MHTVAFTALTFLQSFETYLIKNLAHHVRRCGAGGLDAEQARGAGRTRIAWGTPRTRSGESCACHTRGKLAYGVRRLGAGGLNAGRARDVGSWTIFTRLTRGVSIAVSQIGESCACHTLNV